MKVGQFVATLILVLALCQSSCVTGSGSDKTDKETEQMYNKIFSSSRFSSTIDPDTTQQWLKQLNAQLEDGGKQENVKKLLAFSKIQPDCNLSDGSGNVLVANNQFFAQHSTPTIKAYIANCMTRMYEQCRETFVLDTKEAVNRLKNDPNIDRVSHFKELADKEFQEGAGSKQDPNEPMRQLMLEQTSGKLPWTKREFERLFRQSVGDLCETIRRELEIMMYLDVLLTPQQVRAMGEPVTDWYKVRSVCKEAINEQQAMDKVFKHMKAKDKEQDLVITLKYRSIFDRRLWSLKPEETLEQIKWLDEKLAVNRNGDLMEAKLGVAKVADITRKVQQCDLEGASALRDVLSRPEFGSPTLKRYQKYLRDMMFDRCQAEFVAYMDRFEQVIHERKNPKKTEAMLRLQEWIVENFDPTSKNVNNGFVYDMLLKFIEKQAGAPLSPEMDRSQFDEQIKKLAIEPCDSISWYSDVFKNADYVLRKKVAKQMDPTLRDRFAAYSFCSIVRADTKATSQRVYELLLARGKRQPSSG